MVTLPATGGVSVIGEYTRSLVPIWKGIAPAAAMFLSKFPTTKPPPVLTMVAKVAAVAETLLVPVSIRPDVRVRLSAAVPVMVRLLLRVILPTPFVSVTLVILVAPVKVLSVAPLKITAPELELKVPLFEKFPLIVNVAVDPPKVVDEARVKFPVVAKAKAGCVLVEPAPPPAVRVKFP